MTVASVGNSGSKLLRETARELRRALLFAFLVTAVCNLLALIVPFFNMETFNRVASTRNLGTLGWLAAGMTAGMAVYAVLEYLRSTLYIALGAGLARRLNLPTLIAAAQSDAPEASPGQAIRDLNELHGFISGPSVAAPFDLAWAPLLVGALFAMHWAYGALAFACTVILLCVGVLNDLLTKKSLSEANDETARAFGEMAVTVRNAEAIEAMGMLPAIARRWHRSQERMLQKLYEATRTSKAFYAATKALRLMMTAAMVTLGLVLTLDGHATGGSMVASNMILAKLLLPFEQITGSWRQWISALAAWKRVKDLLAGPRGDRETIALPCTQGRIEVDRLVYFPPGLDRPVLRGISFSVEPGEAIGIIGPSGAGKSTLARLLVGVLAPTAGGVYLDGNSTYQWERGDFGRYVGFVPQALALFDGSVGENIARLQDTEPSEIIAAARAAGLHETIMALPYGYATPVGDANFVLSGGQRQRLALARALFGGPKLLVLDEPNSNLDESGEAALREVIIATKQAGASVVVIAHRPSLLAAVDKLLVLKEGIIDRFGAREAVMKSLASPSIQLLRSEGRA
jgi:ATP-binding cassette subfamily C protein